MSDPLDIIFTDQKEVDEQVLADILSPYLKINKDDHAIFFTTKGRSLSVQEKLLAFLIGRKALKFRNMIDTEYTTPVEITNQTQLKEGSVNPSLKILRERGLVVSKDGKYFVPNQMIDEIREVLLDEEVKSGT